MNGKKVLGILTMLLILLAAASFIFGILPLPRPAEGEGVTAENRAKEVLRGPSLFSWEDEPYRLESRGDFYAVLERLNIRRLYQYISDEALYTEEVDSLLRQTQNLGVEVFYLTGQKDWFLPKRQGQLFLAIDKVAAYNQTRGEAPGFQGIVFDVEPYLTSEWDADPDSAMAGFTAAMTAAYDHAKEQDLEVVLCLPYWFDGDYSQELEQLIAQACDVAAIMNYDREDEADNLETEVRYAQAAGKGLECIFEFQEPGRHELTDNETYYNEGVAAAQAAFERLSELLDYERLGLSYHYYLPLRELIYGEE